MIEHVAQLPFGYTAAFTWSDGGMHVKWSPAVPRIKSRRAQRKFREAYNKARQEFATDVATVIGGSVMIADIDGPITFIQPGTKQ